MEYYAKECPQVTATPSRIPWALDDGFGTMLPVMQSDIMLTRGNEVLIIDAKYYTHTTQAQYDVHTLHSGNLYQIFTYVKNKDTEFGDEPHRVSGMLLYAATDEAIQPDNSYRMSGNQISVKTLDLNRDFSEIAAQLNAIVDNRFEWVLFLNHNLGSLTNTPVIQRLPQPFNDYLSRLTITAVQKAAILAKSTKPRRRIAQ